MCFAPQPRALFDISTAKSGPHLVCFVHFDLEMCFAPRRRALFRHLKCHKWSAPLVFCAFSLGNLLRATMACTFSTSQVPKVVRTPSVLYIFVLRATMACTFSTSQVPKVVRSWCALYILTWKCASRHNGVQFFISHLVSWLRTAALASLLFDPPEPQIIGKTQCFATFLPFRASASSFFWLFLFSDLLSSNLSLLSASALLCFSSVHIVGSLTSKLPSIRFWPISISTTEIHSPSDYVDDVHWYSGQLRQEHRHVLLKPPPRKDI